VCCRLKFCKDYDAYAKLHLSKTDCVRAFQLANSMGHSDADVHEMDMNEFCQCLLFLAKMAGFLGEGDQVPLATQCTLAAAENVSRLLILLGCIVPEVGNRSSRNLSRMKRQSSVTSRGGGGIMDNDPAPASSSISAEAGAGNTSLDSASSFDGSAVRDLEGAAAPQSPAADAPFLQNDSQSSRERNSDNSVDHVATDGAASNNGNLEQVAIASLQGSFRAMNLLPQQKWLHFARALAQAGVSSLQDLLHLGSDDDAAVKFLGEACQMNVIQGRKVMAFLRAQ
jgi:hypothetical protein